MTTLRNLFVGTALAAACLPGGTQAAPANRPMITLQMPALPDPVRVTLDPKTTALLVLDYVEPICNEQAKCKNQMLPAITPFMARVRKAGMTVAYGTRAPNMTKWLPEVAPMPGDIKVINTGQD